MATQGLASQVGVAPACRALGVSRASASQGHRGAPAPPTPARALCDSERSRCSTCSPPLASSSAPAEVVATLLDEGRCARSARCIGSWPQINRCESGAIARTSSLHQARAGGHRAERDVVLGYHSTAGTDTLELLLPLRLARHLQPLRGRLDGRRARYERRPRRNADRANLPQARHRAPGPHTALRPRGAHDQKCTPNSSPTSG